MSQKINFAGREFGQVGSYIEGTSFADRRSLHDAGLHAPLQAGISGSRQNGADSIVLSGGYEDDEDFGDVIIYTGQGGQRDGLQVDHQQLIRGNAGLAISCQQGLPVRVIRGHQHMSPYSPTNGYKYAGVYFVRDYWCEAGQSGFQVWRFRLEKQSSDDTINYESPGISVRNKKPQTTQATTIRRIRDTNVSRYVKFLYDNTCQVCGTQLRTEIGTYSEGAHIQPLGRPHSGPDIVENMLCLCPNHHVMFDYGGIKIADDFSLIGFPGRLYVASSHHVERKFLRYHRRIHN